MTCGKSKCELHSNKLYFVNVDGAQTFAVYMSFNAYDRMNKSYLFAIWNISYFSRILFLQWYLIIIFVLNSLSMFSLRYSFNVQTNVKRVESGINIKPAEMRVYNQVIYQEEVIIIHHSFRLFINFLLLLFIHLIKPNRWWNSCEAF